MDESISIASMKKTVFEEITPVVRALQEGSGKAPRERPKGRLASVQKKE